MIYIWLFKGIQIYGMKGFLYMLFLNRMNHGVMLR